MWVFREQSSMISLLLTVAVSIPFVYGTLRLEEKKDIYMSGEVTLLKEHAKALKVFMWLFIGYTVSFSLWYTFLPSAYAENLFSVQLNTINQINNNISANAFSSGIFTTILLNNLKVLAFCLLFALFFGAGTIFILAWNASIIATAMGIFFRTNIAEYAQSLGFAKFAGYFHIYSLSFLRYFTHGFFEILAYFIAALAGGIISVAIARKHFMTKRFENIAIDSSNLLLISIGVLLFAALVEVYVTPLLF
jgi:uncharacterized membrane protein SpoIIM required for sporulation